MPQKHHNEAELYLTFAKHATQVSNEEAFKELVRSHLRPHFIPHGMLLAIIGKADFDQISIVRYMAVDYSESAALAFPRTINLRERPVVEKWLKSRRPVVIQLPADAIHTSAREREEIQTLGLRRIAAHGIRDISRQMASYFSFAQISETMPKEKIKERLELAIPLLHYALLNVPENALASGIAEPILSRTEVELIQWLAAGRTNAEIARLRNRSPATIKNQLERLYEKLGVSNRAEAVIRGLLYTVL